MAHYNFNVLGQDVSFRAEADPARIEQARILLEERFHKLQQHGKQLSKEKLLTFLALALADDMLQAKEEMEKSEKKVQSILDTVTPAGELSPAK
ncbi:MAG: cell division protein ZapA [Deltaproteobacteria bacterium]|jgi:cell division protein ZapA|nr:cell division protein ZapA [Deltaproteobacteria bacterium]